MTLIELLRDLERFNSAGDLFDYDIMIRLQGEPGMPYYPVKFVCQGRERLVLYVEGREIGVNDESKPDGSESDGVHDSAALQAGLHSGGEGEGQLVVNQGA